MSSLPNNKYEQRIAGATFSCGAKTQTDVAQLMAAGTCVLSPFVDITCTAIPHLYWGEDCDRVNGMTPATRPH